MTAADAERRCSCSTTLADGWLRIYLWFEWLSRDPLVSRCWHWHDCQSGTMSTWSALGRQRPWAACLRM